MLNAINQIRFCSAGRRRRSKSRRGVAMLEFAICVPILLTLILGIVEIGRVMMLNQITTNACRQACRRAIIPRMENDFVNSLVHSYLDRGGVSNTGRTVEILDSAGNATMVENIPRHGEVTVQVTVPYSENSWGFTSIMGIRSSVTRSTMRRE